MGLSPAVKSTAPGMVSKTDAAPVLTDCITQWSQFTLNHSCDEGQVQNARGIEQGYQDWGFQEEGHLKWDLKDDDRKP